MKNNCTHRYIAMLEAKVEELGNKLNTVTEERDNALSVAQHNHDLWWHSYNKRKELEKELERVQADHCDDVLTLQNQIVS